MEDLLKFFFSPAPAWLVIGTAIALGLETRRLGRAVDTLIRKLVLRD
jgi:hypothetical protein